MSTAVQISTLLLLTFIACIWSLDFFKVALPSDKSALYYHLFASIIANKQSLFIAPVPSFYNTSASCYVYELRNNESAVLKQNKFCYYSVVVAGFPKCGTSALYQFIKMSDNAGGLEVKEFCIRSATTILEYFDTLPRPSSNIQANKSLELTVGGCIASVDNIYIANILKPKTKYVYITRSYPDWLWSVYNFWCSPTYDRNCDSSNGWTNTSIHVRSPEEFHEIVINGWTDADATNIAALSKYNFYNASQSPIFYLGVRGACEDAHDHYERMYLSEVAPLLQGGSTAVFLPSEILLTNADRFRKLLWRYIGLHFSSESLQYFKKLRYNTQTHLDSKGEGAASLSTKIKGGRYAISGFRNMLPETIAFLRACSVPDCEWLNQHLNSSFKYSCGSAIPFPIL